MIEMNVSPEVRAHRKVKSVTSRRERVEALLLLGKERLVTE